MNKPKLLKPVNSIMAIALVCLISTVLLDDVIPREIYKKVHPMLGLIFAACVSFHVFLNWSWVKANILPAGNKKALGKD